MKSASLYPCSDDIAVVREAALGIGLVTAHSEVYISHADLEHVQLDEEHWDATPSNQLESSRTDVPMYHICFVIRGRIA